MFETINSSPIHNKEAFSKFESLGYPKPKNDSWKYTSLSTFISDAPITGEHKNIDSDITIVDGSLTNGDSLKQNLATVGSHFENESMYFLTKAHATSTNYFEVKTNVLKVDIQTSDTQSFTDNVFVIPESSECTIFINNSGLSNTLSFSNNHFVVNKNAKVQVISWQNSNDKSSFVMNHIADIERDATFEHFNLNVGSKNARHNISVRINGEGAHGAAHGLYSLNETQHVDTTSLIEHNAAHTTSAQLYKTILGGRSRGIFTGLIRILSHAMPIDSKQLNRNLLLSPKAHANSRPQLEVFADDVKASHGSTTGQLRDEELFYLVSRGIREDKARKLLSRAFAEDVLLKITNADIRSEIQHDVLDKISKEVT